MDEDDRGCGQSESGRKNIPGFEHGIIQPADGDGFLVKEFLMGVEIQADGMFSLLTANMSDMRQYRLGAVDWGVALGVRS